MNRRFRFYAASLCVFTAVGLAADGLREGVSLSATALLLAVLVLLAESMAIGLPRGGSISIAYPLSIATLTLYGPLTGAVVAALSGFNVNDLRERKPLSVILFNTSQLAFSALLSGLAYVELGGRTLALHPLGLTAFPGALVPLCAMVVVSLTLNTTLVSAGISIGRGVPLKVAFREFAWVLPTQLALAFLGVVLAHVISYKGVVALVLFVVPLVVSRQFFQRYLILAKAYRATVKSLVFLIEAKDKYTYGHSERVAAISVEIAQRMGLSDREVEKIELAALLHDIGKIAVSSAVLHKNGALETDEFEQIRRHPIVGAHIVDSVAFLQEVVPTIRHHHERLDGGGYCDGLSGDAIPLSARILAVADSFDAMTSDRPYRHAMQTETAIRELVVCAGKQFDPEIVDAMLLVLEAREPDGAGARSTVVAS